MEQNGHNSVCFGDFRLDIKEKVLRRGDEIISLPPKALDVLCLLAERGGGIVSKNELMDTVWADSFVEESNLTQSVYTLRRMLGNDGNGKSLIENVPRRGYRLALAPAGTAPQNGSPIDAAGELSGPAAAAPQKPAGSMTKLMAAGAAAILLLLATGIFGYIFFLRSKTVSLAENADFQRLTFSGNAGNPIISPDGKSFVYIQAGNIFLQDINTGSSVKLEINGHKIFDNLNFSNGGEYIFFRDKRTSDAPGDIYRTSRFGGEAKRVAENAWGTPGISPDGKQMAFTRYFPDQGEFALIVRDMSSGDERKLVTRAQPGKLLRDGFPAWSPDGKKIAAVEHTAADRGVSHLLVVKAETGDVETIETPRFVQIEQAVWQPDGGGLYLVGREDNHFFQLWRVGYPGGDIQKVTNDPNIYRGISLSADGRHLLARQFTIFSHIWTSQTGEGAQQKQITFGNLNRDGNAGLSTAPDGRIIYASRITGDIDIWSVDPADGVRRQLTKNQGSANENPIVTSDGKFIYFESTRSGLRKIWRMNSDGSEPAQITAGENETDYYPCVSPDGAWLYYLRKGPSKSAIWRRSLMDIANGKEEMLTEPGKFSPDAFLMLSPDGRSLAFKNLKENKNDPPETGAIEVGIISADNSVAPAFYVIPGASANMSWAPDSKAFTFAKNTRESSELVRYELDGKTPPKTLLTLPKPGIFAIAWQADGKSLALARGKQETDVVLLKITQ